MRTKDPVRGFSLVEVVLAVAVCAIAVTVVLALLPALTRDAADSIDLLAAQRVPDALKVEIGRLADEGFDALAGHVPIMTTPLGEGLVFSATRDVARVQSDTYLVPALDVIPESERYFRIECWRYADEPLRYDSAKAFLALHVRVSWPYRLPGLVHAVPEMNRSDMTFSVALNR